MTASKTHDSDFFKAFLLQCAKHFDAFRYILTGMAWVGFEAPQIPVHGASPKQKTPADEDRGFQMVVQCNTTPNAHPEVMSKWAEKIQVSE